MTGKKNTPNQIAAEIVRQPAETWLEDQYLPYTAYVVQKRAIVDIGGLKPVNRRVLWSLFKEGTTPNSKHSKAAISAGKVMEFHPHGNSSIEDALARMAQRFSMRVPLIDYVGNVGTSTGDKASAARYWECRLAPAAMELLHEIKDGAVTLGKNFDGTYDEPHVLPIKWPVTVINGSEGIAVGYAAKIPPHNPDEVMKAVIKLIQNPNLTINQLLKIMPGPDMPTGAEILEIDGIKEYYETGTGRFTMRGRYKIEHLPRNKTKIVFYELPYQVSVRKVIDTVLKLQKEKNKLTDIAYLNDSTDRNNASSLTIITKPGVNHNIVINELFKNTPLETKFAVNNTVLVDGLPVKLGIIPLLKEFISFRQQCTISKTQARLTKLREKAHDLEGFVKVLVDIDAVIKIVRSSTNSKDANTKLQKKFKIDEKQANYILSIQLRKLTKTDSLEIQKELEKIHNEENALKDILNSEESLNKAIIKDLRDTLKIISSERRSVISGMTSEEVKEEAKANIQAAKNANKETDCFITLTIDGHIIPTEKEITYTTKNKILKYGPLHTQFKTTTHSDILIITADGYAHKKRVQHITPNRKNTPTDLSVTDKIIGVIPFKPNKNTIGVLMGTKLGTAKISKIEWPKKETFPIYKLGTNDEVITAILLEEKHANYKIMSISNDAFALTYDLNNIRPTGVPSGGVKSQKLKNNSEIIAFNITPPKPSLDHIIISKTNRTIKATPVNAIMPKGRGSLGVTLHTMKKGETLLTNAFTGNNPLIALPDAGNIVNTPALTKRAASGTDLSAMIEIGSQNGTIE